MHTNWCVLIEISMKIGILNFWLGLLVTAQMEETHFKRPSKDYKEERQVFLAKP